MPKATVSHEGVRHDLKSCPGGFVELRPLSYNELLVRRDGVTSMSLERDGVSEDDVKMQIATMQAWAREYDFRNCIRDHNLTDENDVPLNFSDKHTLGMLDPRIGREIEALIDDLNGENDDEGQMKAFTNAPGFSSTEDNGASSKPSEFTAVS